MKPGMPVYVDGPLDITIGVVEAVDDVWVRMAPGAVTSRDVSDETALVATGRPPQGTTYAVHPLGRYVARLAITGYSLLPGYDPEDWPAVCRDPLPLAERCVPLKTGTPVYVDGPLDITIGVFGGLDGGWLMMAPGAATVRRVTDETHILATGRPPLGMTYAVHPRGRGAGILAVTGISPMPRYEVADWPSLIWEGER
jgi:hypothetical protein